MGFLDFLKGKEYKDENTDNGEITSDSGAVQEESVEEIVRSAVGEIEEETEETVGEDVVVEVVENVTKIENEVNDDVRKSVQEAGKDENSDMGSISEQEDAPELKIADAEAAETCEVSEKAEETGVADQTEETVREETEKEEAEKEETEKEETASEDETVPAADDVEATAENDDKADEKDEAGETSEADEADEANGSADEPVEGNRKGFFARLLEGLEKTKKNIFGGIDNVLSGFTKIDDDLFDELEESLIMADLGVDTTLKIIENLKKRVKKERAEDPSLIKGMLEDEITAILEEGVEEKFEVKTPCVMLVIGVNGVGKTTTIGKLAANYKAEGKKVLLAAADTFRAAAIDQLKIWGERSGIDVICHEENSDPAAVVFDAVNAAKSRKADILICDTAGRLHNKKNLMEELKKIARVINREYPEANSEVFLVLDATTGQNALQQAKLFNEVADITGLVLTKLDGTAKGGIVIAIKNELNIPVRYIGVGERIGDLQVFDPKEFSRALFDK